jgi:hypothetical protein
MFLRICGRLQYARKLDPQIANPQIATCAESPQIENNEVRKIEDWQFVELICGPPTCGGHIHVYTVKSISKTGLILCF